jgi:hypothetical protein
MDWEKFYQDRDRIRQNLNEFTDDIIRFDGTLDLVPGSNADTDQYDQDEITELCKITGLELARVDVR